MVCAIDDKSFMIGESGDLRVIAIILFPDSIKFAHLNYQIVLLISDFDILLVQLIPLLRNCHRIGLRVQLFILFIVLSFFL